MRKSVKIILLLLFSLILLWHAIRTFSHREIDDLNPQIPCDQNYLNQANVVWVIPELNGIPISENKSWCNWVLSLNKTIGLHGITHSYHEFLNPINESQLNQAKEIFTQCFGYEPTIFKPPYLRITKQNRKLVKQENMSLKVFWNQDTHKVFHCENSGTLPNWFHEIF